MALKAHEFERIVKKLKLETRNSGDRLAWFVYKDRKVLFTKRSNRAGDLPFGDKIRTQLRLSEPQFHDLKRCTLDLDGYIAILREKNIII